MVFSDQFEEMLTKILTNLHKGSEDNFMLTELVEFALVEIGQQLGQIFIQGQIPQGKI